jgi:para-aminobenzoate synthetase component 1
VIVALAEPVVVELPCDLDAWETFQRVAFLPHALFLDSASVDPHLGRYSYITANPIRLMGAGDLDELSLAWKQLRRRYRQWKRPHDAGLPPFQGGLAGLWGYGVARSLEELPAPRWQDFDVPDLVVGFYDWVIAFDQVERRVLLICTPLSGQTAWEQADVAQYRAEEVQRYLQMTPPERREHHDAIAREHLAPSFPLPEHDQILSNFTADGFRRAIQQGIDYTHAGDCFQVNLAQRLLVPFHDDPLALYGRLRQRNAAPFGGYFDLGPYAIASASPERFIRCDATGRLETRPIKGTRPRGRTPDEDARLGAELLASAKDRAENIMIVDLLRNDLGRVAEYGSVQVESLCGLESNAAVHHLVSVVSAQLRAGLTPLDVLAAAFPGGSVTGAPKVRAMEIIAELEPTARGAYCGCLGYLSLTGAMDTNILIRTFTLGRGWAQFPVGGGIVADSDPDAEYAETLHKARGMLAALEEIEDH